MSAIKHGGPAFPATINLNRESMEAEAHQFSDHGFNFPGMTLRDYFAIHASDADIRPYLDANFAGNRRQARYQFAADMLRAREAKS